MKKLLLITVLTMSSLSYSACTIEMQVKKEGAKTAYVNGTSVSSKIRTALSTQCKINYTVMSKEEVKKMKIDNLEKRLAKLKTE